MTSVVPQPRHLATHWVLRPNTGFYVNKRVFFLQIDEGLRLGGTEAKSQSKLVANIVVVEVVAQTRPMLFEGSIFILVVEFT